MNRATNPEEALRRFFCHQELLPEQALTIQVITCGRDGVVVTARRSGARVAVAVAGRASGVRTAVIVRDRDALMADLKSMAASKLRPAAVHAATTSRGLESILQALEEGDTDLCYVCADRLNDESFRAWLICAGFKRIVVADAESGLPWRHGYDEHYAKAVIGLAHLREEAQDRFQTVLISNQISRQEEAYLAHTWGLPEDPVVRVGTILSSSGIRCTASSRTNLQSEVVLQVAERVAAGCRKGVVVAPASLCEMLVSTLNDHEIEACVAASAALSPDERAAISNWRKDSDGVLVLSQRSAARIRLADCEFILHAAAPVSLPEAINLSRYIRKNTAADKINQVFVMAGSTALRMPERAQLTAFLERVNTQLVGRFEMPDGGSENQSAILTACVAAQKSGLIQDWQLQGGVLRAMRTTRRYDSTVPLEMKEDYSKILKNEGASIEAFLEGSSCRRVTATKQFGGTSTEPCKICDTCRRNAAVTAKPGRTTIRTVHVEALHFIKATKGRFGKRKVIETLDGIKSPGVLVSQLQKSKEFGCCGDGGQAKHVIRELIEAGLLRETVEPKFSSVTITDNGLKVLKERYKEVAADDSKRAAENDLPLSMTDSGESGEDRLPMIVSMICAYAEANDLAEPDEDLIEQYILSNGAEANGLEAYLPALDAALTELQKAEEL